MLMFSACRRTVIVSLALVPCNRNNGGCNGKTSKCVYVCWIDMNKLNDSGFNNMQYACSSKYNTASSTQI